LLGDLFPPERRARALSIFMLGLPLGLGLSFPISGAIAQQWGWRWALLVAGLPGLILAVLALWIPEPIRGAADKGSISPSSRIVSDEDVSHAIRPGVAPRFKVIAAAPVLQLLQIPTLWWIIASGALHNFNMYANGQFLSSFLVRYHGLSISEAGRILGLAYGFGGLGILAGGWLCDRLVKRRISARLEVATGALLVFVPCMFLALACAPKNYWGFAAWFLPASFVSYMYYSGVYAAIQDIVEPALRGTAMALYFFAMYLLGASLGPYATGWASDYFTRQAEQVPGLLPANAVGLHQAMYMIPVLGGALVLVLFAASRTVKGDYEKLQQRLAADHSAITSIAEKCS
jgi:MFS family permease